MSVGLDSSVIGCLIIRTEYPYFDSEQPMFSHVIVVLRGEPGAPQDRDYHQVWTCVGTSDIRNHLDSHCKLLWSLGQITDRRYILYKI